MKILYMGTPDFAVPPLRSLLDHGHFVCGVFTRPDKPRGRGLKLQSSPVKQYALSCGIPVYEPKGFKDGTAFKLIQQLAPEIIVVVAYGRILPVDVLNFPKYGCINVHASLLPQLRGAAPIQWSIVRGLPETGVTTMHMSEGLDEGDMIFHETTPITPEDTGESLHNRLAELACGCLSKTLDALVLGTAPRVPQNSKDATFAPPISKKDAEINWNRSSQEIINLIHGMNPWPGAWSTLDGKVFRIFSASLGGQSNFQPGTILQADVKNGFQVSCGQGTSIFITQLQAPGGRSMATNEYLRGHHISKELHFEVHHNGEDR